MAQTPTIPMTLLDAVNTMAQSVGQATVMSLEVVDTNEEIQQALTQINNVTREVQMRGWHCNEETLELTPDLNTGFISLPSNTGQFKLNERSYAWDITQRGQTLYDIKNHTAVFPAGTTIYADVVLLLEFAQLPPPIRWYITARAGRLYAVGKDPDTGTFKLTNEVEDDAWAQALAFDTDARGRVLPDDNSFFSRMRRR